MGITNPAEECFKDGLWAWVSTAWEKLISSGGILYNALHGWDGDSWQKLPMLWGYSGQYAEREAVDNVDAGGVTQTFSTVGAGEVWVVTFLSAYSHQANATRVYFTMNCGAGAVRVKSKVGIVAFETVEVQGPLILNVDDYLTVYWVDALANDDFRAQAVGYKMKVAE